MKATRRIISLALTLLLVFSLCAPVFAAENDEQPFENYFVIADSIAIKKSDSMPDIPGCLGFRQGLYAERIAKYFNIPQGYNGAHTGWRTHEALAAIDPDYLADDYTTVFEKGWGGDNLDSIKKWQPEYRANLAKADLITVNLGNNNVVGTLAYSLSKVFELETAGTEYEQAALQKIAEAKEMEASEAIGFILDAAKLMCQVKILVETALADFTKAMKEFPASWDALMAEIREVNPDATIVVISMFNPVASTLREKAGIDLGESLGKFVTETTSGLVDIINCYMKNGSAYAKDYIFVDVTDIDMSDSSDGYHAGMVGHAFVAEKVIDALEKNCVCHHENTQLVKAKAATKLTLGYSGDLVCSDCGKVLEKGHVTTYDFIGDMVKTTANITASIKPFFSNIFGGIKLF